MPNGPPEIAELLRAFGLRSTPQRRAILGAFAGGSDEHLSADEVHARASQAMPDLGRGTVYATLAEFTELGLLAAFGAPEPVRYETNTEIHDHFRCRLCLRVFDFDLGQPSKPKRRKGFAIERIEVRAEGVCADCADYASGLRRGVKAIHSAELPGALLKQAGVAARGVDGPLGTLLMAANQQGLIRVAFEEHADAPALRALAATRRGSEAARQHLARAGALMQRYFSGQIASIESAIDWDALPEDKQEALRATREIPYAGKRSYLGLGANLPAKRLGMSLGENPIPVIVPCHRVTRGVEMPQSFVGGTERRHWLLSHEEQHEPALRESS
jgi:Fe2+ or Zn2+ uptake regulation protein/O6-methylguanine-DNA--protein-cysteine methyltransferase